jgi:hypothetical protein
MTTTLDAMKKRYELFTLGSTIAVLVKWMGFVVAVVRDDMNIAGLGNPHDTWARFDSAGIIRLQGQAQSSARCGEAL